MDEASHSSAESKEYVAPRAHRLVRGLTLVYGVAALTVGVWLFLGLLPAGVAPAMAREWIIGGLGAIVFPTLLVAFTGSLATLILTGTRLRHTADVEAERSEAPGAANAGAKTRFSLAGFTGLAAVLATAGGPSTWDRRIEGFFGEEARSTAYYHRIKANPGFAARQGQAVIVTTGAALVWIAERLLWPTQASRTVGVAANVGVVAVVATFALAFVSLAAERFVKEFPGLQLPEAPTVRRLLLFSTLMLVAAASLQMCRSVGITSVHWLVSVLAWLPGVVMLELALRALARLFLPPPLPSAATAVTDSMLVALITGGRRAPGTLLRTHLGLDFSRSWALAFLSKAFLPAIFGTGLLCWGLSGVKMINLGQRGIYERFGAPVAVLGPGLHMVLPWPFGRLRPVEYGEIHSVAIGVDKAETDESVSIGAEAPAPLALNRLWESSHPDQAHYLVASEGTGQQGFQSVDTEISVLYRVGLSDSAALQSVYAVADPETLIRDDADRLVLGFFNSRTLEEVIGARRENVGAALRDQLAADVNSYHVGIEIVSVLIEEIHPPVGAASAYHAVQAAEINATASIFHQQAQAELTNGKAQQQAYQTTTAADAKAAEVEHAADAAAYRFNADRRAFVVGGRAFLLERFYGDLDAALSKVPVTIIDNRLNSAEGPILDLRGTAAGASGPAATAPLIPEIEGRR
ncbi:MAG TPA: SPFH domain-containing protein [Bryobacteraceae bacterium]|nr:SPFH domain-containing protein [Bryobacteraceae bacterium]